LLHLHHHHGLRHGRSGSPPDSLLRSRPPQPDQWRSRRGTAAEPRAAFLCRLLSFAGPPRHDGGGTGAAISSPEQDRGAIDVDQDGRLAAGRLVRFDRPPLDRPLAEYADPLGSPALPGRSTSGVLEELFSRERHRHPLRGRWSRLDRWRPAGGVPEWPGNPRGAILPRGTDSHFFPVRRTPRGGRTTPCYRTRCRGLDRTGPGDRRRPDQAVPGTPRPRSERQADRRPTYPGSSHGRQRPPLHPRRLERSPRDLPAEAAKTLTVLTGVAFGPLQSRDRREGIPAPPHSGASANPEGPLPPVAALHSSLS